MSVTVVPDSQFELKRYSLIDPEAMKPFRHRGYTLPTFQV